MDPNRRISMSGAATSIPIRSSAIPRPSSARPGSSSGIPSNGPMGNYHRPASRISSIGSQPTANASTASTASAVSAASQLPVAATPFASRTLHSGVGIGAPSNHRHLSQSAAPERRTYTGAATSLRNSLGLSGSMPASASGSASKRTVSAAGISEDVVGHGSATKRPATRRLSSDGTSPLLLQADLHPALMPRPESPSYELSILRANYDQQLLSEERKYKKLEEGYETKCRELDRYNNQRVELLAEWDRVQETQREKEHEWQSTRRALEDELLKLRSQNAELRSEADESRAKGSGIEMELRRANTALESQVAHLRAQAKAAEAEAVRWKDEFGTARAEVEDLENALEDEKRQRLEERESNRLGGEEGKKISEELSRQTSYVRKLEAEHAHLVAENGRLQHHASNVELLKEEKRSLEAKVRLLDELRAKLADAESAIRDLEQERREWQELLQHGLQAAENEAMLSATAMADVDAPLPTIETPTTFDRSTLPSYLGLLRGSVTGLEARVVGLQASLDKVRRRNAQLEDEAADAEVRQRKVQNEFGELRTSLVRAERTETRLHDEIARLKAMLKTYETEERNHAASYDAANAQRIRTLEVELERLGSENGALQQELEAVRRELGTAMEAKREAEADEGTVEALRAAVATQTAKVQALEVELAAVRRDYAQLEKEAQEMVEENEKLYLRVGRGEFDQAREKCLVLVDNPVSRDLDLRKSTLEALKRENQGLLRRVEEVSKALAAVGAGGAGANGGEGGGGEGALVPKEVVDNLKLDILGLQESIKAKDKAMLRLKQVFSAKANEFREAIQSLFGYKVKFLENGKVKVTSTFSRSSSRGTSLVFSSEEGNVGAMKLQGEAVEVNGLANLQSLRDYWLDPRGARQSVPCFLAALNLELYESCTMAIRRGRVDEE
ncbi:coiled-coil domain-containing protein mad1 [Thecaphora frezii]